MIRVRCLAQGRRDGDAIEDAGRGDSVVSSSRDGRVKSMNLLKEFLGRRTLGLKATERLVDHSCRMREVGLNGRHDGLKGFR